MVSVCKTSFKKQKPQTVTYRDYKRFDNEKFEENLITNLAPTKQKHIRGNQSPFMNKDIHKAIMTKTRLGCRFLKEANPMNRLAYKKQRNYCISVMHENKKQFHGYLNVNSIAIVKTYRG